MAASYPTVSMSNLVSGNKTWQEAVDEPNFLIYQKNGLYSNAEFIISSILYHSTRL